MSQASGVRVPSPSARRATSPNGMVKSNITVFNVAPTASPSQAGQPHAGSRPVQPANGFQLVAGPGTPGHASPTMQLQPAPHPNTYYRAPGFNGQGQPIGGGKPLAPQMHHPPPAPQPFREPAAMRAPSPQSQGYPPQGNRGGSPNNFSPSGHAPPGPPGNRGPEPPTPHLPPPPPLALLRVQHQLKTANDQQRANLAQLRNRYDQLLQHNENLGEEFLRLRMVLDELREGVRGCVRHHVFSLRNSFSELKEMVQVQCTGMAEDFDTVRRVVSKLGRQALATSLVSPLKSGKGNSSDAAVITNLYDKTPTRSTPGRRATSPARRATPGSFHLGPFAGSSGCSGGQDDRVVQLLQDMSVQKAVLEERMMRIEEEHARHVRHLKLLHQDRENTLLSQLNMLSTVADRRDRETAAAIELSAYRATAATAPQDQHLDPMGNQEDVPSETDFGGGADADPVRRGIFVDSGLRFAKGDLIDVASPAPVGGRNSHLRDDPHHKQPSRTNHSSLERGQQAGPAYSERYLQKRNAGASAQGPIGSRTRTRPQPAGERDSSTGGLPRVATLRASSASRRRSPEVKRMSIIR